ncbi:MAG: hypothetical protein DMF68_10815 [Acidobacteria bacterium]|nr:MAG: hypothetical protein DMF68_10815 [Acidobacteriota bacterium]
MQEFAKTGSLFAGVRIITLVIGLAQMKFIAVTLGPSATGIYTVISNFLQILTLISTLNLSVSASKYLSEYYSQGDFDRLRYALQFCVKFVLSSSAVIFLAVILLTKPITLFLFDSGDYWLYVVLTSTTILFGASTVYLGGLQGLLERTKIAKVQVWTAILGLASVLIFIPFLALTGYFISVLLTAFFTLVLVYVSSRRVRALQNSSDELPRAIKREVRRKLFAFSGANLILLIAQPLSFFLIRYSILKQMGTDGVGFYAACLSASALIFSLFQTNAYYYFPKMNTVLPEEERVRIINECLRFTLLTFPPVMLGAILLPDLLVWVLYSNNFLPIVAYLPLFILAEFAMNLAAVFSVPVLGLTKLRFHVLWTFVYYLLWATGSILLFNRIGLRGVGLVTIVAYLIWGGGYYIYLKGLIPLRIEERNVKLLVVVICSTILFTFVPTFLPGLALRITVYPLTLIIAYFLFDRQERKKIGSFAQQMLRRFRFSY